MGSSYAAVTTQADSDAQITSGASGASARDNAIALTGGSKIGDEYNAQGGGSITVNNTAAGAEALAEKFTKSLEAINSTASLDRENSNSLVTDALNRVAALAESKQTEGISSLGKIALWGVGLIVGGFVAWKIFSK